MEGTLSNDGGGGGPGGDELLLQRFLQRQGRKLSHLPHLLGRICMTKFVRTNFAGQFFL